MAALIAAALSYRAGGIIRIVARSGDWTLTREDLWALPGIVLIVMGLVLQFRSDHGAASVVLGAGVICNTVFVLRRAGREQRWSRDRSGR
jgi:uncharacterized membrane protein HdeD (DUF308 family)